MRETIVDRAYAKTLLPPRKEDGHKGDFGKLLVLGGSVGYTGAPYLAASAAVHSGCGLVYLGVPEKIYPIIAAKVRERNAVSAAGDRRKALSRRARQDAGQAQRL